jgi:hypothetical protein
VSAAIPSAIAIAVPALIGFDFGSVFGFEVR